ncbi:MAG: WavE lipopolysaccharide synthesis family protein [Bacteroidales bacterium]|nr:WavE lipopolysaccharide synthesis family protein [Candidatus Latescibacterota bacterium]
MAGLTLDVILQGPIAGDTYKYAQSYLEVPDVKRVIISTWKGQPELQETDRLKVIYSDDLANPGQNNRNRQIFSTQKGLEQCSDFDTLVVKTRTDQHIRGHSWETMKRYFMANYKIEEKFLDGTGPKGAIFAIGLYTKFVFHPQDHLFMGFREDMDALFGLPLDPVLPVNIENPADNVGTYSDWAHQDLRPNAYIGMHYYARFDEHIQHMVDNFQEYIVDEAVCREEALAADKEFRDKIFKVFPPLDVWWGKHHRTYPYEWGAPFSEYHA